jgi:hypothetical protein
MTCKHADVRLVVSACALCSVLEFFRERCSSEYFITLSSASLGAGLCLSPNGFDLNGAWGPSALYILDFTALSSQATTEPQARIKRRSIQVVSRTISQMNASLIRARQPLPSPNLVQYGT